MSQVPDEDAFQQFVVQRKKDLQRIARATRGEHQFDDVVGEAWIMACSLQASGGSSFALSDADCQHKLIGYLYQHLVRFTEKTVRNAIRLDHAPKGSEYEGEAHPLAYLLASDDGRDVLSDLLEREADAALESDLAAQGSLAVPYVYLLRRFGNNMSAVADYLRISRSHAYHCYAYARWLAIHMTHIPTPFIEKFIPGPWRLFRLRRPHVQLVFDFDHELLV